MGTSATWGGGDGDWFSAGNWTEPNPDGSNVPVHYVPGADNDAIFNGTTAYTITYDGVDSIMGIEGDDSLVTLDLTGGLLGVGTDGGVLYALDTSVGATFAIDDVPTYFTGALVYRVLNAIDNQGEIRLNALGHSTRLVIGYETAGTPVTLSGGGVVAMSDNANNEIFIDTDASLDNIDNTILGAGAINSNFTSLTNESEGVIDASYADNGLSIVVPTVTNHGLIEATGAGGLQLGAGGVSGDLDNSGGEIEANGAGAHVDLQYGEHIDGGTVSTSGGGVIEIDDSNYGDGFFDGETDGALTIAAGSRVQVNDGASLNLSGAASLGGGIVNEGEIDVDGATATTQIDFNESSTSNPLTLSGGGAIKLTDSSYNKLELGNSTVLDNIDNTISGAGQIGASFTSMINEAEGVIDATGTDNALIVTVPGVTNKGLIEDTGTAGLVFYTGAGSSAVDNQGGTIAAKGAGAHVDLGGGASVAGGELSTSGGGVIRVTNAAYGATLDGSTDGALTIAKGATVQVDDGGSLYVTGTTAAPGVIYNYGTLALDAGADSTRLAVRGGGTTKFEGGGQITLSDSANNLIDGDLNTVFENVDNTISGAGAISADLVSINNDAQGVIDATGVNNALTVYNIGMTNAGLMEDTGAGGLTFGDFYVTNAGGTIAANGAKAVVNFVNIFDGNSTVVGGTLSTSNGGAFDVQSALYLQGAVTAAADIGGAGTLEIQSGDTTFVSGAALTVQELRIDGGASSEIATSLNYGGEFANSGTVTLDGSTLELSGTVAYNGAIDFASGGAGVLELDASALPNGQSFADTIGGFSGGDVIDLTGLAFAGNTTPTYNAANGTLTVTEGGVTDTLILSNLGATNLVLQADATGGTEVVCFASGTRIRTSRGDVAVERLAVGDLIVTSTGEHRPIRWIGHRTLRPSLHPRPGEAAPVRITAHAFGENRPARDLYLSPGHSICLDVVGEALIPAIALVNGATVRQVQVDEVTYWHVELDRHDILLAENLPAESYIDMGNRGFFQQARMLDMAATPDGVRASLADYCRPFHVGGPLVEAARMQLRRRALSRGWSVTDALELHLEIGGRRIEPEVRDHLMVRFRIPTPGVDAWLVAPTSRPCDTLGTSDDRRLGVCLQALTIVDDQAGSEAIALDDVRLCEGFHRVEDSVRRWTEGAARLPAKLWGGRAQGCWLILRLEGPPVPRWVAPGVAVCPDARLAA